ncbi:hypothetical protein AURDEDRAFT_124600 [Auricularia subglabra TFB-10046 SS5]|nr:hypothetical protein AURDEDRAFT_124600 [Auricularia subglabra TFB-10046 SS5]
MPPVRVLTKLTVQERSRIVDVLTEAFSNREHVATEYARVLVTHIDILIVNVLGGERTLIKPCMEATVYVAERCGEIHVISGNLDSPEDIDGVALWFPPGRDFEPTEDSGWFEVASQVASEVAAWWEPLFAAQDKQIRDRYHETASHDAWYLFEIGIAATLQRKRLGSHLMQYAAGKADADGARIIVNTSDEEKFTREMLLNWPTKPASVAFYQANGLMVVDTVPAESPAGPSWTQILMVREPTVKPAGVEMDSWHTDLVTKTVEGPRGSPILPREKRAGAFSSGLTICMIYPQKVLAGLRGYLQNFRIKV